MQNNLTVTQAAKKFGLHPNTLKNWEQQGRVVPERDSTNRRIYTPQHQDRIREVLREAEKSRMSALESHN